MHNGGHTIELTKKHAFIDYEVRWRQWHTELLKQHSDTVIRGIAISRNKWKLLLYCNLNIQMNVR
jgi:hypothetical protein